MLQAAAIWKALTSPLGLIIGAVVAGSIWTAAVYTGGWNARAAISREEQYKAERDAAVRDLLISQNATKTAEELADAAELDAAEARKKADDYAKKLPKGTSADLTDFDVKQLRDIRNRKRR
jgi:hypothetical protein